jgi:hypothetical protein
VEAVLGQIQAFLMLVLVGAALVDIGQHLAFLSRQAFL